MLITMQQFWMGRDTKYAGELTAAIKANAEMTVQRANALLSIAQAEGVVLEPAALWGLVNSGWRPAAVNAGTPGAATHSHHMTGEAVDVRDPSGRLDAWCIANSAQLAGIGLWQEHPDSTPGWCHLQIVAPHSGNRVFRP